MSALDPGERDELADARSWRGYLRPDSPLVTALATVSDETLLHSYKIWWRIYTREIRSAPSNRGGGGVEARDAYAAGRRADEEVLHSLRATA